MERRLESHQIENIVSYMAKTGLKYPSTCEVHQGDAVPRSEGMVCSTIGCRHVDIDIPPEIVDGSQLERIDYVVALTKTYG